MSPSAALWASFLLITTGASAALVTKHDAVPYADVCCPGLGCFNNQPPFDDLPLPMCPDKIQPEFHLYTRLNFNERQYITRDKIPSLFRASRKTILVAHGFRADTRKPWMSEMKNELLKKGDFNVILFDWGKGANIGITRYTDAASNSRVAGAEIALILDKLSEEKGMKYSNVHLIGHSLGAHACGFAGDKTSDRVGRISGMDPAGPWFNGKPKGGRLDSSDAVFVDILHTHSGTGLPSFGHQNPIGHVDFFPNGGRSQPGCLHYYDDQYGSGLSCSHSRAYIYYIESINSKCPFTAAFCDSRPDIKKGLCDYCSGSDCQFMGFNASPAHKHGTFYLKTTSEKPFCKR